MALVELGTVKTGPQGKGKPQKVKWDDHRGDVHVGPWKCQSKAKDAKQAMNLAAALAATK